MFRVPTENMENVSGHGKVIEPEELAKSHS